MSLSLEQLAWRRRLDVLEMVRRSKGGHIGGSMSCMDILVSLYYEVMDVSKIQSGAPDRDRFILSKGHCAEGLYAVLADRGFFPKEELDTYAAFQTRLAQHPTRKVPGVGLATGIPAQVYVLMGDGEQAEGSVWEAAMAAAKYKLSNLTAVVDRNRLQISGCTEDVMPLDDLAQRYRAFGWNAVECNGHCQAELCRALRIRAQEQPTAVICSTIKGYGSPVMENRADWHHKVPNDEEYTRIREDLLSKMEER